MIIRGTESREKILKGINENVDTVKRTLGAKGRNVMIIDKYKIGYGITKDGVSVSNKVFLDDDVENAGSQMVQEAAGRTVREAGDGTTTTSVLTQSMCNSMFSELNLGKNVYELCSDLKLDLNDVIEFIKIKSKEVKNTDHIKQIAKVSSNNDEEIANIIKEIYDNIGLNGIIEVREDDSTETTYDLVHGLTIPNTGYSSTMFINNQDKGRVEFENANVFILNGKLSNMNESLMELIEMNRADIDDSNPLVLLLQDIEDIILRQIVESLSRGLIKNVTVVQSNLIYKQRENRFKDACAFLDAEYSDSKIGGRLGFCEKVIIEKDQITFVNGRGNVDKYLTELKKTKSKDAELKSRIFSLESKGALINVGGKLQTEIKEKRDRVDDAVLAVKSAIEEGFCAGGSSTFIFAKESLNLRTKVMKDALMSCYIQLMENANIEPYFVVKDIIDKEYGYGYNVGENRVENLLEIGIIDSSKVLRISLENATQVACLFATIDAVIN